MARRRAKWGEMWETGIVFVCTGIWSTFDLLEFKVILGLFGALVPKCVWYITVPEFENKKSMHEIFHYGTASEI